MKSTVLSRQEQGWRDADALTPEERALVESVIPLVGRRARRIAAQYPGVLEVGELVNIGMGGAIRAAQRFDPAREAPFWPFAAAWADGEMRNALRRETTYEKHELNLGDLLAMRARSGSCFGDPPSSASAVVPGLWVNLLGRRCRTGGPPEALFSAAEERAELPRAARRGLEALPEDAHALVRMHAVESRTLRASASLLGVSYATAKRWFREALVRLRAQVETEPLAGVPSSELPEHPPTSSF
jgi:RNA polymerase sigma factor (sigma-70 family)